MILLDTNVISELMRAAPDAGVAAFLRRQVPASLFTAAVCEAEIRYGLSRLPAGCRRDDLVDRVERFLAAGFEGQILPFDSLCAALYGAIRAHREAGGKPISVEDAMIAATARAHGAVMATRNVEDFAECGIAIVNPWNPS